MTVQQVNLTAYQGDTYAHEFQLFEAEANGPRFDLTGWTVLGQFRRNVSDSAVEFTAPTSVVDGANGVVRMTLSRELTRTLSGSYVYDIQISDHTNTYTFVRGTLRVEPEVTRNY